MFVFFSFFNNYIKSKSNLLIPHLYFGGLYSLKYLQFADIKKEKKIPVGAEMLTCQKLKFDVQENVQKQYVMWSSKISRKSEILILR